jgi:Terminase large subunit, T4likevirus-type, N-terminal
MARSVITTGRWHPQPKQAVAQARARVADEVLFGGAAFGGKTYWLVQHCFDEMIAYPGNRGVIFRRVFPSLARTIVPKVRAFVGSYGDYMLARHEVRFYNGSVLELGALQYDQDVDAFQGAEYGVVGFEELTEFTEAQYLALVQRLRAPVDGVRPHAVATTNPGGVGHRWVKRRFVRPEPVDLEPGAPMPESMQIWRPRATEENSAPGQPPLSRCFVPAVMDDNAIGLARDPMYRVRLRAHTSRARRHALEFGDWDVIDAVEGALWEQSWLDAGRVDEAPDSRLRVIAVDPSDARTGGDAYGVCVASLGTDNRFYVERSAGWHKPVAQLVDDTVALMGEVGADRLVVERNHGGAWMVETFRSRRPNVKVNTVWASDNKRTRAEPVSVLFEPAVDSEDALPRASLVGYHPELEDQLTTWVPGAPSPDELDALVWAISELVNHGPRRGGRVKVYPRAALLGS